MIGYKNDHLMFASVWVLSLSNFQVNIKTIRNSDTNFRSGLFFFLDTKQYYFLKLLLLFVVGLGF